MGPNVNYEHITDPEHPHKDGFASVYAAAFGEAPYFEVYTRDEVVENVWLPHIPHCVVTASVSGEVVGLGCAHPVLLPISSIGAFLQQEIASGVHVPFPLPSTLYMSELAVLSTHRGHGIGRALIEARLEWARRNGFSHYCMRTAAIGSNSRHLYESLGAQLAPSVQNVESESVESKSKERIYLYGKL